MDVLQPRYCPSTIRERYYESHDFMSLCYSDNIIHQLWRFYNDLNDISLFNVMLLLSVFVFLIIIVKVFTTSRGVSTLMRDIYIAILSVCLSVCLSVTFRYSMKTVQYIVMVSSPHGIPIILRFKICLYREKCLHISFWCAFSLYLTSAADLNSLVLLPGGLLWMPYQP